MFSNECTKVGDYVVMLNAVCTGQRDQVSGIRGRDICAEECGVYKINKVRTLCNYQDKFQLRVPGQGVLKMYEDEFNKMSSVRRSKYIFKGVNDVEYYISVPKQWCASGKAKANLRVYRSEFLNLTFLNSVDLAKLIESYSKDVIVLGDTEMKFSYAKKYIEVALAFVVDRESQVATCIMNLQPEVLDDSSWPKKLAEWMFSNNVHKISEYRIKQFLRSLKSKK